MSAATSVPSPPTNAPGTRQLTLLELVQAICEVTSDEREIVATVVYLLRTGRVELRGNFRGTRAEDFC